MPRESRLVVVSWFTVLVCASTAFSESAFRKPSESYQAARDRNIGPRYTASLATLNAEESKVAWGDLDFKSLPIMSRPDVAFDLVRDSRYLTDSSHSKFLRRSSWLYPQDGCWIRAALARKLTDKKGHGDMKKLFIFGSLTVKTKNAPGGSVSWWYHVVPIFTDYSGQPLVMDPAISPNGPMLLEDWAKTMVSDVKNAKYSLCEGATFSPSDSCQSPDGTADKYAESDQSSYLSMEWDNLLYLKRDPERELADNPPWLPY